MGTAIWGPTQLVPVEGKAGKDVACKNGAQDGLEPGCKRTRMQTVAGSGYRRIKYTVWVGHQERLQIEGYEKKNQVNMGKGQYWQRAPSRRVPGGQRGCHLAQGSVSLGSALPCWLPVSCFLRKIDTGSHVVQAYSILGDHSQCPPAVGQPEE